MWIVVFSLLVLTVTFFVYGALRRKAFYKRVDKLEDWKNDILQRPIPDEIGKVKGLTMSGETEEKFEVWRSDWDDIVGVILPNVEEQLFDVEDFANKYRFQKAKALLDTIEQRLHSIEEQLKIMVDDIQVLVQSEEQNRTEIGSVRELQQKLIKEAITRRGSLSSSAKVFDEKLEKANELLQAFDERTEKGNYIQASEVLEEAKELLGQIEHLLKIVPGLFVELQTNIPAELTNLKNGLRDMEEAGFFLETFAIDSQMERLEEKRVELLEQLTVLECNGMEEEINFIEESMEQMFELLEKEVEAKNEITILLPNLREDLTKTEEKLTHLKEETESVQLSYRLAEEELVFQQKLGKELKELRQQLQVIDEVTEEQKQTFSSVRSMLEEWREGLTACQNKIEQAQESLNSLRKDELKAKEELKQLKEKLLEDKRLVQKSNIPGLPETLLHRLEDGEQKLAQAIAKLSDVPLEMGRVTALVDEAQALIHENSSILHETIEKARLAEHVIQYGNRYRSRSAEVKKRLSNAEELFRAFEYDEAIEMAVQAIEPFEKDVLEKVQHLAG
ncbi:septation ring formation regulator EzrA [Halalkalibacterium halodurans]|uniref:septation ring formation regulator EzrA n=1 Tax=Halalkalibacterium halodurans TaxID=86665 RepID=UPI0010680039|nr:septation ring formation regulator EzrA [Halalkalibacterium halodurans]TES53230.1 septation ring formation regulator EzrA [Halalkalibacterium halodurans]